MEGHSNLAAPFRPKPLSYEEETLEEWPNGGRLRARQLTPETALRDYLDVSGLSAITNRMARTGAVDIIATAAPGIRDLLALGKIRQLEQGNAADLIIVDAPAAGHAITFLRAPTGLAGSAASGPVRHQAELVLDMFADEHRCQVMLATLPEEAAVNELIETAYSLEDLVGIRLAPLMVNCRWPEIDGLADALDRRPPTSAPGPAERAARFRLDRIEAQQAEIQRLHDELPLPRLDLPFLFTTSLDRSDIEQLADALVPQLEAVAV